MDVVALESAKADAKKKYLPLSQNRAWSIVSSRPVKLGLAATTATYVSQTTRISEVAPFDIVELRLIYANWQNAFGSAESPNYCAFRVKAAVHRAGASAPNRAQADPVYPATFGGKEFGLCPGGQILMSDPISVSIKKGERYWHESYGDIYLPAAPAAPTLTATAGGSLASGTTYYFQITYVFADGAESLPSAEASVTPSGSNLTVTVTSPTAANGAVGYRVYFGTSSGAVKYESPNTPMAPIGTNTAVNATFVTNALNRLTRPQANLGLPLGKGFLENAGENAVQNKDYVVNPVDWTGQRSNSSYFQPIGVLGLAADGRQHSSVVLIGDSIQAGTGDNGFGGQLGGSGFRACANQTAQIPYDATKTPNVGFLSLAQGGETVGSFATAAGGTRRRQIMELGTTIYDNYGTNDLGSGAAPIYANILSYFNTIAGRKKYFRATIDPKTTSTDAFKTVTNQTINGTDAEADRRALNNIIKSTTGAVAVAAEAMFRSPTSGTATPATDMYSGGDGSAVKFFTAHPFLQGTEVVKVNGATKAVGTDYTYRGASSIDGGTYASGITFTSAPANAATVTISYTKVAGFGSRSGFSGYFDTATEVEVNGAGAKTANGGFWPAAIGGISASGTATSTTSGTLVDTSQAWTTDQWRGLAVRITADSGTPAAVGTVAAIDTNTANTLTCSWSVTPSATASYEIFQPYVIDGVHGMATAQRAKSLVIDTSRF